MQRQSPHEALMHALQEPVELLSGLITLPYQPTGVIVSFWWRTSQAVNFLHSVDPLLVVWGWPRGVDCQVV